mmetsp:Transcript_15504/g.28148  ORF Transcript_15504/g.28148 Transcript_15504/m.28148 type:complete len:242 (-) Transcript_15504:45-770(-)
MWTARRTKCPFRPWTRPTCRWWRRPSERRDLTCIDATDPFRSDSTRPTWPRSSSAPAMTTLSPSRQKTRPTLSHSCLKDPNKTASPTLNSSSWKLIKSNWGFRIRSTSARSRCRRWSFSALCAICKCWEIRALFPVPRRASSLVSLVTWAREMSSSRPIRKPKRKMNKSLSTWKNPSNSRLPFGISTFSPRPRAWAQVSSLACPRKSPLSSNTPLNRWDTLSTTSPPRLMTKATNSNTFCT